MSRAVDTNVFKTQIPVQTTTAFGLLITLSISQVPSATAEITDALCVQYCGKNCFFDFQGNEFMQCQVVQRSCICTANPPKVGVQVTSPRPKRPKPPRNPKDEGDDTGSKSKEEESSSLSTTVIVGIAAGVVLVLCLVCIGGYCIYKMKKKKQQEVGVTPAPAGMPMQQPGQFPMQQPGPGQYPMLQQGPGQYPMLQQGPAQVPPAGPQTAQKQPPWTLPNPTLIIPPPEEEHSPQPMKAKKKARKTHLDAEPDSGLKVPSKESMQSASGSGSDLSMNNDVTNKKRKSKNKQ